MTSARPTLTVLLSLAVALAGCGGGGGEDAAAAHSASGRITIAASGTLRRAEHRLSQ